MASRAQKTTKGVSTEITHPTYGSLSNVLNHPPPTIVDREPFLFTMYKRIILNIFIAAIIIGIPIFLADDTMAGMGLIIFSAYILIPIALIVLFYGASKAIFKKIKKKD